MYRTLYLKRESAELFTLKIGRSWIPPKNGVWLNFGEESEWHIRLPAFMGLKRVFDPCGPTAFLFRRFFLRNNLWKISDFSMPHLLGFNKFK